MFFSDKETILTDTFEFDIVKSGKKLAPFVAVEEIKK